jgi:hypothetical protein
MPNGHRDRTFHRTSRRRRKLRRFAVSIAAGACLAAGARAAPPAHVDPALAPWFRSLANPVSGISCCAEFDGHILASDDWRETRDGYQVQVAGIWHDVPAQAVLNHVENPTGGAVAFFPPGGSPIYCFIRPTDS